MKLPVFPDNAFIGLTSNMPASKLKPPETEVLDAFDEFLSVFQQEVGEDKWTRFNNLVYVSSLLVLQFISSHMMKGHIPEARIPIPTFD